MGDLNPFKTKKPDTRALEQQEKLVAQQEKEQRSEARFRAEKDRARRASRARGGSRGSLLSGLETGVTPVDQPKRSELG